MAQGQRKQLTGLQKWQLAVKFLAMTQQKDKFNYLTRHQRRGELKLDDIKMTSGLEKAINLREQIQQKR